MIPRMAKRSHLMNAPTLMLWRYAAAVGVASALVPDDAELPKLADLAASYAFPFIVAAWVMSDARNRGRQLCYDYDSFVFFAWPVVVPVYLFQTRGARAFLTLLWAAVIGLFAGLAAFVVTFVQEFLL